MTFEELIEKQGQATVFNNTEVDAATQGALIEWFFDYPLCTPEDEDPQGTKFMRYFQRNINLYHPRYLQLLRVMGVKDNLDPYVTEYLEEVTSRADHTDGENTSTFTPTTTDTSVISGGHTDTRTPLTRTEVETENTTKSDNFAISYPESQLDSITLDIDIENPQAARSIDYASNESLGGAKSGGKTTTQEIGQETNAVTYQAETTTTSHTGSDTTKDVSENSTTSDTEHIHKGRNESVADIIPRAMSAITGSDPFTWFKKQLTVCFDCFA